MIRIKPHATNHIEISKDDETDSKRVIEILQSDDIIQITFYNKGGKSRTIGIDLNEKEAFVNPFYGKETKKITGWVYEEEEVM